MNRLRALLAAVVMLAPTACTSTWHTTYVAASATADYIEDTHRLAWSEPLRERVAECDDELPSDATRSDVDECLGTFAANPDVVTALEQYNAAAAVLSAVLLATDPDDDPTELLAAWADVVDAARDLVALLPAGERRLRQLDAILEGAK